MADKSDRSMKVKMNYRKASRLNTIPINCHRRIEGIMVDGLRFDRSTEVNRHYG